MKSIVAYLGFLLIMHPPTCGAKEKTDSKCRQAFDNLLADFVYSAEGKRAFDGRCPVNASGDAILVLEAKHTSGNEIRFEATSSGFRDREVCSILYSTFNYDNKQGYWVKDHKGQEYIVNETAERSWMRFLKGEGCQAVKSRSD